MLQDKKKYVVRSKKLNMIRVTNTECNASKNKKIMQIIFLRCNGKQQDKTIKIDP